MKQILKIIVNKELLIIVMSINKINKMNVYIMKILYFTIKQINVLKNMMKF